MQERQELNCETKTALKFKKKTKFCFPSMICATRQWRGKEQVAPRPTKAEVRLARVSLGSTSQILLPNCQEKIYTYNVTSLVPDQSLVSILP